MPLLLGLEKSGSANKQSIRRKSPQPVISNAAHLSQLFGSEDNYSRKSTYQHPNPCKNFTYIHHMNIPRTLIVMITVTCLNSCNLNSGIINSFKQVQHSFEKSNQVLVLANDKILDSIHKTQIGSISSQADTITYANQNLNGLIEAYKKQIQNLDLTGENTTIAYEVIATPDIVKAALMSASSNLTAKTSTVIDQQNQHVDSLLKDLKAINTNKKYFEETFQGMPSASVLATLSALQVQSSEVTNLAMQQLLKSNK